MLVPHNWAQFYTTIRYMTSCDW